MYVFPFYFGLTAVHYGDFAYCKLLRITRHKLPLSVSLSVFLVLAAPKVVIVLCVGFKVGARLKVCAFALELTAKRYHVAVLVEVRVKRIAKGWRE